MNSEGNAERNYVNIYVVLCVESGNVAHRLSTRRQHIKALQSRSGNRTARMLSDPGLQPAATQRFVTIKKINNFT
jgi:hypothetical protein